MDRIDLALGKKLIELRERVVSNFDAGNWEEVGLLTGFSDTINTHPRLLRSLAWGDEDYAGNVLTILRQIIEYSHESLKIFEQYLDEKFPGESHYISAKPSEKKITFAPNVFQIPDSPIESDLVALMIPFSQEFEVVYETVKSASATNLFRCQRASDIWEDSTIIQDIFSLIYRAHVVVIDFTGKNPNVMYELGIAHTLGKHVIPITQSLDDIPFDIAHHRALKYLKNTEGLTELKDKLSKRLRQLLPADSVFR
ncbi:MAG: hypothetical protein ACOYK8_03195 [Alphaproteobacteria bacterium]